jgi:hypothetical protein
MSIQEINALRDRISKMENVANSHELRLDAHDTVINDSKEIYRRLADELAKVKALLWLIFGALVGNMQPVGEALSKIIEKAHAYM